MQGVIRVLVVDDHNIVAETLTATLGGQADLEVVGVAHSGTEALELVRKLTPDVVLLDFRLPDMSGIEVVRQLAANTPTVHTVVLTGSGQERAMLDALDAGALGFLTKEQSFHDVVDAVRRAARGEATVSPELLTRALPEIRRDPNARIRLTRRERDVLELLAEGKATREMADQLFLSVNTIRNHVASTLTKLGAHTRLEAVAIAAREGLITPRGEPPAT